MDRSATEAAIKLFFREIRERLCEVSSIFVTGEACAKADQDPVE